MNLNTLMVHGLLATLLSVFLARGVCFRTIQAAAIPYNAPTSSRYTQIQQQQCIKKYKYRNSKTNQSKLYLYFLILDYCLSPLPVSYIIELCSQMMTLVVEIYWIVKKIYSVFKSFRWIYTKTFYIICEIHFYYSSILFDFLLFIKLLVLCLTSNRIRTCSYASDELLNNLVHVQKFFFYVNALMNMKIVFPSLYFSI